MEVIEKNKDGPSPSTAVLWIVSVCEKNHRLKKIDYIQKFFHLDY